MDFVKIIFRNITAQIADELVALLAEEGYEGFEEMSDSLYAYVESSKFIEASILRLAKEYNLAFDTEIIKEQNWNALWESNFEPVVIEGFCTLRANFHTIKVTTPYEIIITPKMSFGTGHHATTQLMMLLMKDLDFTEKSVFDFGTGTGVLAILAEKLGARDIVAIDNDEWAVENTKENIQANSCNNIKVHQSSIFESENRQYDIILANINRHILLANMSYIYLRLINNGYLLLSGLLPEDEMIITNSAEDAGFKHIITKNQNNWIALLFVKI